jgi:hypothetical protein
MRLRYLSLRPVEIVTGVELHLGQSGENVMFVMVRDKLGECIVKTDSPHS